MMSRGPLLLLLIGVVMALPACRSMPGPHPDRADPAVLAELRRQGEVQVIVTLQTPVGHDEPGADGARLRAEIARMQDNVLASLEAGDFSLRIRFESVPALAGTLHAERGLRTLAGHPDVRQVGLDPEGDGERAPGTGARQEETR